MKPISFEEAISRIESGKIGIVPTDTLYGLVASAMDPESVERVYRVRGRDGDKPCIVLIADISDLDRFSPAVSDVILGKLRKWWPGKVSVILPCPDDRFTYLHRGTGTIAFRMPDRPELRDFLRKTGPIIAPSANQQGMPPAKTVGEAEKYFGSDVDFYVDSGTLDSKPSTVVRFTDGKLSVVREGAVKIQDQES